MGRVLFRQALELDPADAVACRSLASILTEIGDSVLFSDGTVFTGRDLLVRAKALERWRLKSSHKLTKERWSHIDGLEERGRMPRLPDVLLPERPRAPPIQRFSPPRSVPAS